MAYECKWYRVDLLPWLALAIVTVAAATFLPVNQDSIWQAWVGREMLGGAKLYTDILEVNPPLLFWLSAVQAAIGEFVGLRAGVVIFCLALAGVSLWLTPARYRLPALVAMAILPMADYGKAEQLTVTAAIPYAFLIAARIEGREVRHPWLIGFLAALGFAMKPYFIMVPLPLECLAWKQRRVRPETVALAVSAVAYAGAVLLFAPTYLTDVVPMVREAYATFRSFDWYRYTLLFTFAIAIGGMAWRKGSPTAIALGLAALAFLPAVFLQGKGWPYQSVPPRAFLFLAIVAWAMSAERRLFQDALLFAAAILCFYPFGPYRNTYRAESERHLQAVPRGASVAVLSVDPGLAWPMVEKRGLKWGLSTICLWQMPASGRSPAVKADMEARLARDLSRLPDLIIIDRRAPAIGDALPPGMMQHYRRHLQTKHMQSFVRATPARQ